MRIRQYEIEGRIFCPGALDHFGRKIHPNAMRRFESGQQVAETTTNLKHAQTRANQEAIDPREPTMVSSTPAIPFIAFASNCVPMGAVSKLINLSRGVKEGGILHDDPIVSVEFALAKVCVIIQRLNFGDMETSDDHSRELTLLEQVEHDPDVNQSTLASQLGVAVGTVNWHLKRLVAKGYVKVQRAERKKLRYIITPEGIALRARLTVDYIERSFDLYRKTRRRIKEHLDVVRAAGFNRVRVIGEGDVAEICKLSCLEQGVAVVQDPEAPALELKGWKVILNMGDRT